MKRFLLAIITLIFLSSPADAAHIIGGEMRYTYAGPGVAPNSKIYTITLLLFRGDDPASATLAPSYVIGIFNNDNGQKISGTAVNSNWLITQDNPPGIQSVPIILPTCIQGAPSLNYTYASYSMTIELPDNSNGYTAAYQTCCRINGLMNVGNSTGSTYNCIIPGLNQLSVGNDSSPQFSAPVNVVCTHGTFAVLMGYYIGLAKFDQARRKKYMLLAVLWPVIFHGTFDFFLFVGNSWLYFAGALVSFIVAIKLSLKLIRRKQEMSRNHHLGIDTITGNNHDIF